MVVLENEFLKITITLDGGSLTSIYDKKRNNELLYQKDSRSWQGQDVVIFPFVARLKNSKYKVDGLEYSMKNHGLVRYSKLNVWENTNNKAILYLDSTSESLLQYPFNFHFEVIYELNDNILSIRYKIVNTDNKKIYYEFGGHPAFKVFGCENDYGFEISNTILEFPEDINTNRYFLDETGSYIVNKNMVCIPSELVVTKKLIEDAKTIILDANNILECALKTRGYRLYFNLKEAEVLALWTSPGFGDYLCVEPWWGIPDIINPNPELRDKPLMHSLNPKESEEKGYSITISWDE